MKKLNLILISSIIFFGCGKTLYEYNVYELEECLGQGLDYATEYENHQLETFDQGIYVYQNCRGLKDIDGVKVNWLEDEKCKQWKNFSSATFPEKSVDSIYNLTNDLDIPQRFFLIFLDKRRVLYFTNHESATFFKKHVKYIYESPMDSTVMDSLILEKIKKGVAKGFFKIRKKKKSEPMDYAFMPLNWHNWENKMTYDQVIPIQEKGWKKHMKGVYKTYKDKVTNDFYVKISFDTGKHSTKDREKKGGEAGGLIELLFQTDSDFKSLKLLEMNIPDSSVNLQSENEKGAKRRNLFISEVFAIQPIFECKNEPVKLSLTKNDKTEHIEQIILEGDYPNYKEAWIINGETKPSHKIEAFWKN